MPRLALYQPDMPPNVGAMIRLGACLNVPVDIIEPCGFPFSLAAVRRSALDYGVLADIRPHADFAAFDGARRAAGQRLLLLTTQATTNWLDAAYRPSDILMVGRESAGAPPEIHAAADLRLAIPMAAGARSLNVALAAAIVLGEMLRQGRPQENGAHDGRFSP